MKLRNFFLLALALFFVALAGVACAQDNTEPVELPTTLLTLLSFFAPLVFQVLLKNIKNELGKFLAVLALSGLTGVAAIFFSGSPWSLTVPVIERVFVYSALAYKIVWKPMVFQKVAALESKPTSY